MRAFLLALFWLASTIVEAKTYYFSTESGDDARSAVQAQNPLTPWKTINKLNSIFGTLSFNDEVLFKRGETFYGSIVISSSLSKPITIGAYGNGAKPIITGLHPLSTWSFVGGGIYESTLTQDNLNLVTFQDTLQPLGRWPKLTDQNRGYLELQSHVGSSSITSNAIGAAKNFTGGEVVIRKWGWILDRGIVNSQTSTTVGYTPIPSVSHPQFSYQPTNGFGFFFQNHINALTQTGDWMYDKAAKKVRVYFGSSKPTEFNVQVASIDNLVNINLSSNIKIENVSFKGSNSNSISINNSYKIEILNCDINLSGINAITTERSGGSSNITVRNCSINNSLNNGINSFASSEWIIQNNLIQNTGMIGGMGLSGDGQYIAISSPGAKSLIEYNEIKNTGYHGIEFKGDNTIVKNNFIDHFSIVKSDGGGIYNSQETGKKGRKIIGNIVLNGIGDFYGRAKSETENVFAGNVHGIYMDGGATDVEIIGNTAANCSSSGLELSSSVNTKVLDNTFYNNTYRQIYFWESSGPISNLTLKNNILFATGRNHLVAMIDGTSNTTPNWGSLDSNFYCRPIDEPNGIDTLGWGKELLDDYTDGGIIQTYNYRYLSLDKWQQYSKGDMHSKKTPIPVTDLKNVRFEYNATNSAKTISLDTVYVDVRGNVYTSSITLSPYSSVILLKPTTTLNPTEAQTINFPPVGTKMLGEAPFTPTATASSGLTVGFRIISGPATVSGNKVTLTGTGTVVIEAIQDGGVNHVAAAPVRQSFEVIQCTAPTFVNNGLIILNASCTNNDGNISIIPTSGTAPFLYSIDGGNTYVSGPDAGFGFMNLSAGTYQLKLKDAKGCESAIVEKEIKMICSTACVSTFSYVVKDAGCNNNDGSITIKPTSGVPPFKFSINGGVTYANGSNTEFTFSDLAANGYSLKIKDANGCESTVADATIKVDCQAVCQPPTFVNNGLIVLDATCSNNDGNVSIIPLTGVAPFKYSMDGGVTYFDGPNSGFGFMNLSSGTYKLRLKDALGCESAIIEKTVRLLCNGIVNGRAGSQLSRAVSGLSISQEPAMNVYPNPTNGAFKLQLKNFSSPKAEISVLNGEGKLIQKRQLMLSNDNVVDFNIANLPRGIYYIKVTDNTGARVSKIVKQ